MIFMGEVIAAYPPSSPDNLNKLRWEYTVRGANADQNTAYYYHCFLIEQFSGLTDFSERVVSSSGGSSSKAMDSVPLAPEGRRLTLGDRCLFSFIEGDRNRPVILGFFPHPNSITHIEGEDAGAQMHTRYNGMDFAIDVDGQFSITHLGKPSIEQEAPYSDITIEAAPSVNRTSVKFLKDGIFNIQDNSGHLLDFDPVAKTIFLNNRNEQIYISQDEKLIEISSTGNLDFIAQANIEHYAEQDYSISVGADYVKTVSGKSFIEVSDASISTIGNTMTTNVKGDYTLNVRDGNVNINTKSGHVFFMDDTASKEAIFLIHKAGSQVVLDKKGSVKLIGKDGSYAFIDAETGNISFTSKSGALISIKDQIVISDKTGKQIITMKADNIEINSGKNVTVSAVNVNLNSGSVTLGAQAVFSSVLGEKLVALFNSHSHASPVGPVSVPLIPLTASGQLADPLNIVSSSIKLKA